MSNDKAEAWFDLLAAIEAWNAADHTDLVAKSALADAASRYAATRGAHRTERAEGSAGGALIPFGKDKGKPVAQATDRDLKYLEGAMLKSIENPEKSKWVDSNRALLSAIRSEMRARGIATLP